MPPLIVNCFVWSKILLPSFAPKLPSLIMNLLAFVNISASCIRCQSDGWHFAIFTYMAGHVDFPSNWDRHWWWGCVCSCLPGFHRGIPLNHSPQNHSPQVLLRWETSWAAVFIGRGEEDGAMVDNRNSKRLTILIKYLGGFRKCGLSFLTFCGISGIRGWTDFVTVGISWTLNMHNNA